jgi:hypothetical protein
MSGERFPLWGTSTLNNLSVPPLEGCLEGNKADPSSPSVTVAKEEMTKKTATLMRPIAETDLIFIAFDLKDLIYQAFGELENTLS